MAMPLKVQYGPRLQRSVRWLPVVFFLVCALGIAALLQVSRNREIRQLRLETEITAQQVKHRLEAWIDSRAAVVPLLARSLAGTPQVSQEAFVQRAESFLALYPGFQALNYIDADYVIRIICPVEGNQAALGRDLHAHPSSGVEEALDRARQTGTTIRTPLIDLLQGRPGFAAYCPVVDVFGRVTGFVNGVFSVHGLVEGCLSEEALPKRFRLALINSTGKTAYATSGADAEPWPGGFTVTLPIRVVDRQTWNLHMALRPEVLARTRTGPDEVLALGGTLLSLVAALLLRAYLRRMAELRVSRENYRLMFENAADMVVKIDAGGAIAFSSPSTWRFLGKREDAVLGRRLEDFASAGAREKTAAAVAAALQGTDLATFEAQLETAAGLRWTSWSGSPLRAAAGHSEGLVAVGRDITAKRELEAQLLHSQKLQAVGRLAGGIAHDFNNLLQAIQGYVELVMADLPQGSPAREDLRQASLAADRASRLTRQLLAFSSRQAIQPVALDLHAAIGDLGPMLKTMLGDTVTLNLALEAVHPVVRTDPGQFHQVLMNLCVNARDAIDKAGSITVATANEEFAQDFCAANPWARPGRWIRLDVTDTGRGIPPQIRAKVFEPFFTTKAPGQGTGLGLATVYGIVQQHAGLIRILDRPGGGTIVSIHLPQDEGLPQVATQAPAPARARGRETLLLVEDQEMVRELAARILQNEGYEVLEAGDGVRAVQLYEEHRDRIALAILDLVLPGLDGRSVRDRILQRDPRARLLFISGFDPQVGAGGRAPSLEAELLPKPFTKDQLLQAVRRALDRQTVV